MSEQQLKRHTRRQTPRRRLIIALFALLLLVTGAVVWILNTQGIITGSWSSVLASAFTVLGVIFGFFQWFLPLPPKEAEAIVALQEQALGQSSFKSGEETKYADILEILGPGLFMLSCAFCRGNGRMPTEMQGRFTVSNYDYNNPTYTDEKGIPYEQDYRDSKDYYTYWRPTHFSPQKTCLVCDGKGVLKVRCPDIPIKDRHCYGTGHEPDQANHASLKLCTRCKGVGCRSLTGKVKILR